MSDSDNCPISNPQAPQSEAEMGLLLGWLTGFDFSSAQPPTSLQVEDLRNKVGAHFEVAFTLEHKPEVLLREYLKELNRQYLLH